MNLSCAKPRRKDNKWCFNSISVSNYVRYVVMVYLFSDCVRLLFTPRSPASESRNLAAVCANNNPS